MKRFGNPFLSLAAPFLILVALLGLFQREGREKVQSLPAILVGTGLIFTSGVRRHRRRKMLLFQLKNPQKDEVR